MEYNVGQVVYLLNPKSLTIVPALIVEEVIRKTIEKQTKQYIVELPGENEKPRKYIEDIQEVIFNDIQKLRDHMLENTRKSVEQLINNALEKKDIFFGASMIDLRSEITSKEVKEKILSDNIEAKDENKKQKHVQKDVKDVIMNGGNNLTKEEKWK